jgi:hypothetical protein
LLFNRGQGLTLDSGLDQGFVAGHGIFDALQQHTLIELQLLALDLLAHFVTQAVEHHGVVVHELLGQGASLPEAQQR